MTENREITVQISDEILVHAPKMTKAVAKWGVYAIPRLWRDKTGRLIVRFNGEQDTADKTDSQQVPNLFFASYDEGETWQFLEHGEEECEINIMTGVDQPYLRRRNGDIIVVKTKNGLMPIRTAEGKKELCIPPRPSMAKGDIPHIWRDCDGNLLLRFLDGGDGTEGEKNPELYFLSADDGDTWKWLGDGEIELTEKMLQKNKGPFYVQKDNRCAREVIQPNRAEISRAYRYGEIPEESKGIILEVTKGDGTPAESYDIEYDFPEKEVPVNAWAWAGDRYKPMDEDVQDFMWKAAYFTSLEELEDGTLVALAYGHNPKVEGHFNGEFYLLASVDDGRTWKKKSVVASSTELPFGYGCDSGESSLVRAENGDLLCAMRMETSIGGKEAEKIPCGTMYCRSTNNGLTWTRPVMIADSSVTPHLVALKDGIVILIYGRPGVHFKYSADNGVTWSQSYPIIGKTLEEERAAGRSDAVSKYGDMKSYSNSFVEKISEDTVLVLYTDVKYDDGSGQLTKAGLVKKITIKKA